MSKSQLPMALCWKCSNTLSQSVPHVGGGKDGLGDLEGVAGLGLGLADDDPAELAALQRP